MNGNSGESKGFLDGINSINGHHNQEQRWKGKLSESSLFFLPFFFLQLTLPSDYFDMQEGRYAIVTDRSQKFTEVFLDQKILDFLAIYADEFLVHGMLFHFYVME